MANARALDIAERQIAIDYYEDEQFSWHHRILLISAGNGRWILATPDHEVQYQDLSDKRVVPLARGARFPVRVRGDIYAFDPITREELNALYVEARALAEVVGVQVPTTTTGPGAPRWVISDPAHELFGSVLDNEIAGSEARLVVRGAAGLAEMSGEAEEEDQDWVQVQNVAQPDHDRWLSEKRSGPGRDPRVCPARVVGRGPHAVRRRLISEALQEFREEKGADWPFRGPGACLELFRGVAASGLEFPAYANHYLATCGVATNSTLAHELRNLFAMLHHLNAYDQLDCPNVAAVELLCRRVLQVQKAIRKSPKHPDFANLDGMLSSTLDESGGVIASEFDQWVASEQKVQATIMKHNRMFSEEQVAENKKQNQSSHAGETGSSGEGRGGGQKKK